MGANKFPVCAEPGHQGKPDVWDDWVVWHDNRNDQGYDIYAKNLSSGLELQITNSGKALNPCIDNGWVVWQDLRGRDFDIYAYNLSERTEHPVYLGLGNQINPSIQGGLVVWRTGAYPTWPEIWAYSMDEDRAFLISGSPGNKWIPSVFGNIVVWGDYRNGDWDVYGYDVSEGAEFPIVAGPGYQREVTVHEGIVVYQNLLPAAGAGGIGVYDLSSGEHRDLPLPNAGGSFDVYDRTLVWCDYRATATSQSRGTDIYGYNIDTDEEFEISCEPAWQHSPAISAATVVWCDDANGGFDGRDIYGATAPRYIYVDAAAGGARDGSSWIDAYRYLQDALANAASADHILVAAGVYTPDIGAEQTPGDRFAAFEMLDGVELYGGFPPGGGRWHERDPNRYETVLSGILNQVHEPNDGGATTLDGPDMTVRAYHVVKAVALDNTAVLDGFTVTAGNADGASPHDFGGGILCIDADPTIRKCTVSANSAFFGGGICITDGSKPTLTACTFKNNYASSGGAAANYRSAPVITDCEFMWNTAFSGGAISNYSGAVPVLERCVLAGNHAQTSGGALYNHVNSLPSLINCLLTGNSAENGGAVYVCSGNITNCTIAGNRAEAIGGALYMCKGPISNSIIWKNAAGREADQTYDTPNVTYSCVQNGATGQGCISSDPCFADPGRWDTNATPADTADDFWIPGDYHLKSAARRYDSALDEWVVDDVTSICIDAGNPGSPTREEPNVVAAQPLSSCCGNPRINMGAYGGTTTAAEAPPGWASPADLSNDARVEEIDLALWAADWLNEGPHLPGDLDRNQFVDFDDYTLLAGQWLLRADRD